MMTIRQGNQLQRLRLEKAIKGCKNKTETNCLLATPALIAMPWTKTKNETKIQCQLTSSMTATLGGKKEATINHAEPQHASHILQNIGGQVD